jgi:hypothetical protein
MNKQIQSLLKIPLVIFTTTTATKTKPPPKTHQKKTNKEYNHNKILKPSILLAKELKQKEGKAYG